jgi:hypothetical protein
LVCDRGRGTWNLFLERPGITDVGAYCRYKCWLAMVNA